MSRSNPLRVMVVMGTRPEVIKLAPVVRVLEAHPLLEPVVVTTGQHTDLADDMLAMFGLVSHHRLRAVADGPRTIDDIAAGVLVGVGELLARERPDVVLVQGDTTTTMATALAAHHALVEVVHLEAGLRTGDLRAPHPEEANRRIVSTVAALHLAPTTGARRNLLGEGTAPDRIVVTGNTVVDALEWAVSSDRRGPDHEVLSHLRPGRRLVLATMHRRESWGAPLRSAASALADVARAGADDVEILVAMHPNPTVRDAVSGELAGLDNAVLTEPLSYPTFARALARAAVVVTDSGGVQEEAPAFGVPVVVMREATERTEAIDAGLAVLVGTDRAAIVAAVQDALAHPERRTRVANPFGDGRAAERTVAAIAWHLGIAEAGRPADFVPAAGCGP